jgi:hypothetical protein
MDFSEMGLFDLKYFIAQANELIKERKEFHKEPTFDDKELTDIKSHKMQITTQSLNFEFIPERIALLLQGFRFDKIIAGFCLL